MSGIVQAVASLVFFFSALTKTAEAGTVLSDGGSDAAGQRQAVVDVKTLASDMAIARMVREVGDEEKPVCNGRFFVILEQCGTRGDATLEVFTSNCSSLADTRSQVLFKNGTIIRPLGLGPSQQLIIFNRDWLAIINTMVTCQWTSNGASNAITSEMYMVSEKEDGTCRTIPSVCPDSSATPAMPMVTASVASGISSASGPPNASTSSMAPTDRVTTVANNNETRSLSNGEIAAICVGVTIVPLLIVGASFKFLLSSSAEVPSLRSLCCRSWNTRQKPVRTIVTYTSPSGDEGDRCFCTNTTRQTEGGLMIAQTTDASAATAGTRTTTSTYVPGNGRTGSTLQHGSGEHTVPLVESPITTNTGALASTLVTPHGMTVNPEASSSPEPRRTSRNGAPIQISRTETPSA